ncbi:MAG: hypothetical protein NPINA01_29290 [Nitrospinaceae bacterium]|nr:MAG: hypothetical protein NPINA01_29290 [Nitrospinaceae bacterium]
MKRILLLLALFILLGGNPATAGSGYEYQLYKNSEDFGIVVFPKEKIFGDLNEYIESIIFKKVESGKAVMRSGSKGENETFMMPLETQKKHAIEKFLVIQVLSQYEVMIGVYDPEWGLTLPSAIFGMEEVKKNIPKTLDVFRGDNPRKEILWRGSSQSTAENPVYF